MEIVRKTSPYIRKETSTKRMMIDVLIALIPVVAFAIYRFKMDAVIRILTSLVIIVGGEAIWFGIANRSKEGNFINRIKSGYQKYTINNITAPAVTAIIYTMLLPNKLPIYAVIVGALFGIVFGKMIFGGLGQNIFNPAAMGRIFLAVALTGMFSNAYSDVDLIAGATPLTSSFPFPNILNNYSLKDLFLGNIPGAMGEISSLAILIGMVYLLYRRSADYRVVVSSLGIFILGMFVAGIVLHPNNLLSFVLFQLLSGGILFGAVFMITDPVTSPVTRPGRWIYGILIGFLVVVIRLFGAFPEGMAFALLIGNMLVPLLDNTKWSHNKYQKRFVVTIAASVVVMLLVVFVGVGGFR